VSSVTKIRVCLLLVALFLSDVTIQKMKLFIINGKFVPVPFLTEHHAMKACRGSGVIALRILDLGTRWR